jgi:hypothetical protein
VNVRVDERGCEHEAAPLDDAVTVCVDVDADLRDHAAVDTNVEELVDPESRIEDPSAADDEVVVAFASEQH